jgi:hypothetical protein
MLLQVGALLKAGAKPAAMAQQMAKVAFDNSLDKSRMTPYSRAATEAFDMVRSSSSSSNFSRYMRCEWSLHRAARRGRTAAQRPVHHCATNAVGGYLHASESCCL